ncbi:MAG TPA: chromosomal replication initiator DnaA [Caulobacteraceae bacterium]|nr:chromosomal replication initiator DnaA [Caulobacteraceae bacterium]
MPEAGRQLRLDLRGAAPFRRDDFIVSPANAEALRALDAWPHWHAGCLTLVGPQGSGKSHLAQTWAGQTDAAVLAADQPVSEPALARLAGRPVLVEDADGGANDELLFHLINMAGARGGGLLLTARRTPSTWATALPDLRSRLNALPVAELLPPDDAILTAAFGKFFRERNIRPAADLIPYLLARIERSIPRARAFVATLDETADAEQRPVSRALARRILENEAAGGDLFD